MSEKPPSSHSFDSVAEVYDATRSLREDAMERIVEGLVERLAGDSILDVGVGTGRFAAPLAKAGLEVTGIDISTRMISRALAKGVSRLVIGSVGAMPFVDGSFDYALAVHVLHLVDDWRAAISEIARVAKNGLATVVLEQEGTRPRDIYIELREKMGYPMGEFKHGERELVRRIRPAAEVELVRYSDYFRPEEILMEYAARLHSATWDVPEEVNRVVVEMMRPRLGAEGEVEKRAILFVWRREQLLELTHQLKS